MAIFVLEVVLKLMEHFWAFWASNWNLVDFLVTLFCVVCETMKIVSSAVCFFSVNSSLYCT